MEFIEAFKIVKRMCEDDIGDCIDCPLSIDNNNTKENCYDFMMAYPEEAEEILTKWAEEHPQKTILKDFLEKYPNAYLDKDGIPMGTCPYYLGYDDSDKCIYDDVTRCKKCWNRPLED